MKFKVRDRVFGIGDDYWIEDEAGRRAFLVDGKALRLRQTFELKAADGSVAAVVKKKVLSLHKAMAVERDGEPLATVRKKHLSVLRDRFKVELADGAEWSVKGDIIDKEYEVDGPDGPVAAISRKWFRIRDTYAVEVADGYDVPLVLAVAVAVDALNEEKDEDG
ncbi:LURP-one-related/scramblase family protein [Actinomadura parmotrematis]|uniref:LURP-one-related family protein n=1 Tax=Actinomadura parmotrematis TaxID=2864039 RepID=A0ABS7FZF8_9ACTN|nr:LURP-one-related family protein [Actinomadura parmotrematis]MBW8485651.1 LURP-one-related family protein [Actinomadura parmotrematis]